MRRQTTDLGRSENTNQDKYQKTTHMHVIFKLKKTKNKEKILSEAGDGGGGEGHRWEKPKEE